MVCGVVWCGVVWCGVFLALILRNTTARKHRPQEKMQRLSAEPGGHTARASSFGTGRGRLLAGKEFPKGGLLRLLRDTSRWRPPFVPPPPARPCIHGMLADRLRLACWNDRGGSGTLNSAHSGPRLVRGNTVALITITGCSTPLIRHWADAAGRAGNASLWRHAVSPTGVLTAGPKRATRGVSNACCSLLALLPAVGPPGNVFS